MNCANCSEKALFIHRGSGIKDTPYCNQCLPSFLRPQARAGVLPTTDEYKRIESALMTRLIPEPSEVAAAQESEG